MKIVSEGPQYLVRLHECADGWMILEVIRQHGFRCVREYWRASRDSLWRVRYRG